MKQKMHDGGQPAVLRARHGRDQRVLDLQRRRLRGIEVGKGIREKRHDLVGRHAAVARDFDGLGRLVIGTHHFRGRAEIAVGVDDDQRGRLSADGFAGVGRGTCRRVSSLNARRQLSDPGSPWTEPSAAQSTRIFSVSEE